MCADIAIIIVTGSSDHLALLPGYTSGSVASPYRYTAVSTRRIVRRGSTGPEFIRRELHRRGLRS